MCYYCPCRHYRCITEMSCFLSEVCAVWMVFKLKMYAFGTMTMC